MEGRSIQPHYGESIPASSLSPLMSLESFRRQPVINISLLNVTMFTIYNIQEKQAENKNKSLTMMIVF
jgi:hypothetical protein